MIRFCLASASRSALGLLKRPRRERYNSADIFTRYRHEDASTIMSEPAISATGHLRPYAGVLSHRLQSADSAPSRFAMKT